MNAALMSVPEPEKPSASIVYVTPEMAERWLARNIKNRDLKERNIARFARDMMNGRWQITGEAIKFDTLGNLLDGQNRLTAVIASGAVIPMFVVRGLGSEAQQVMDSGAPRSPKDALGLLDVSNAKDVAPVAAALMSWQSGFFKHCMWQSSAGYTNSEIVDYATAHPEIGEVLNFVKPVQKEMRLPIGAIGACAVRFALIDADAMTDFYDRIKNLHTSGKGDPVATLIKRVSDERQVKRRLWISTSLYFQVRAWNAFRAGEKLEKFQIGSDKAGWAQIPEPK